MVSQRHKSCLKIFFGYAEGAGKTYAMLEAAREARRGGTDVVIGCLAERESSQILDMAAEMEHIPCKKQQQNGRIVRELNLDAIVRRKPQLVVVDDLAHTNAKGSRHRRRFQDVEEILRAGIDVYTTADIQNIESLNDLVASITGKVVKNRIPDSLFDHADQVELIDIEPQEVLARLSQKAENEGRQETGQNILTIPILTALREMALRRCADRVNRLKEQDSALYGSEYRADEHILVCLSPAPSNAKIIRTAARMAAAFRGSFTALFVETTDTDRISDDDRKRLWSNMHLAQQLGAQIETVYGEDVALQILEFSQISGVSKIVIGRSAAGKRRWNHHNLTEKLLENTPDFDVYIIPDSETRQQYKSKRIGFTGITVAIKDLLLCTLVLVLVTLIGFAFAGLGFTEANIITVYILGVLIISVITTRRSYSLVASVISVLVFNFFFTVPRFTFQSYDQGYPVTFAVMFLAALIMGSLAAKLKSHARESAQVAYRTKILFDTNQLLQKAAGKEEIFSATAGQLAKLLHKNILLYPAENGKLSKPVYFPSGAGAEPDTLQWETERNVAEWAYQNNKHAGATTDTFSNARYMYLAIRLGINVYGVAGIETGENPLEVSENSMLLSILGECALALENEKNAAEKEAAAIAAKNEQLRANLLRAISHDLRTPLTSISGNASNLLSNGMQFDENTRKQIYTDIYDDSMWLINLVENLLAVTRIEEGRMNLRMASELMEEVIAEAMQHVNRKSVEHHISIRSQEDFILARMDARLIVQTVINIVDNAIKYTQVGSYIDIYTGRENGFVFVRISDDGPGIAKEVQKHVFDMFYSGKNEIGDSRRSLGLGLALCKSIINAHGGEITVTDNLPHGAVFTFTLPEGEVKLHE